MEKKYLRPLILSLILLIIIILIIFIIISFKDEKKGKIKKETEGFEYTDDVVSSTEMVDLKIPSVAFYVYEVINQLPYSALSDEVMLNILDEYYISYYNINEQNIKQYTEEYINKNFIIKSIKYSMKYDDSLYMIFVECEDDYNFVIKYSPNTNKYKIFLNNFTKEQDYNDFISNKLLDILDNSYVQGNKYNYFEPIYDSEEFIYEYYSIIKKYDFDYLYNNIISEDTRSKYSYDTILSIYNDESSFFKSSEVYSVNMLPKDDGYKVYTFIDSGMVKYTLTENSYFNFNISLEIVN